MIEQHRTMEQPGAGIVRDAGPNKQYEEYPKMMTHPGFRPGKADREIKVVDENGNPTGQLRYVGGESVRFAPVLVRNRMDEDYHASQGYEKPVKCDAAAFARLVADAQPVVENYKPIEYPKYVFGKIVYNAEQAEAWLIEMNINADGSPREAAPMSSEPSVLDDLAGEPALDTDVNTLEVWPAVPGSAAGSEVASEEDEIAAIEARLAVLKAKKAEPQHQISATTFGEGNEPQPRQQPEPDVTPAPTAEYVAQRIAIMDVAAIKAERNAARVAKIKATMARKKAEKTAAALRDEVQAEAGEAE